MKEATKTIRKALKKICKTLSVCQGRGTAYSYVEISGSGEYGNFTETEKNALRSVGINFGGNFAVIGPDGRDYWLNKFSA